MALSLAAILAETAARRPDHPAIIHDGTATSYRDLWVRTLRYARVLRGQGIGPGDRVALLLTNTVHFPLAYFAVLTCGAVVVPVNALLMSDEIAYVLRDSGARALVCAETLLAEGAKAAELTGATLLTVLQDNDTGHCRLDVLAADAVPVDGYTGREPGDLAVILYTSGTTGQPKGAMLTQLNVLMNVDTSMLAPFDFRADDVLLGCLPLFHTFGQICGMCTCFRAGATMVLMSRFDAAEALDLMVTRDCTLVMGVPTMYVALLETAAEDPRRPRRLDRFFSGGSALPVTTLDALEETFGCRVYEGYGLTETSPVVAYNQKAWPCKPGTVGRAIRGVEVAIAAAEVEGRVQLLAAGEVGEIVVRGHNVMAGYLNRPQATAEVMVDGWFRTGDLGVCDDEGYLSIVDRKKDMILRGGYNVYPREIEEVLVRHPAIAQVAVIGVADLRYGEEVCAVVRLHPDVATGPALAAEITAWSRQRMARYKYPRVVKFVDAFPLGPSGKVLKRDLVARFAATSGTDLQTGASR